MPRGFVGAPATVYLKSVEEAHALAAKSMEQVEGKIESVRNSGLAVRGSERLLSTPQERQLPFSSSEASSGGFFTGVGNSSNIVVSMNDYNSILRQMSHTDDRISDCLYQISSELEEMCRTSFILPAAVPRCLHVSDSIKRSLGQFRSVTDDAVMQMKRYVQQILDIGY